MPAHALIPNWEERGREIEAAGIYGPRMYLSKIRRPILDDFNISRDMLKGAGLPSEEADEIADRRAQEGEDETAARKAVLRSLPNFPAPLTPPCRVRIAQV